MNFTPAQLIESVLLTEMQSVAPLRFNWFNYHHLAERASCALLRLWGETQWTEEGRCKTCLKIDNLHQDHLQCPSCLSPQIYADIADISSWPVDELRRIE